MLISKPSVCLKPEYFYLLSRCHKAGWFISFGAMKSCGDEAKACLQHGSHILEHIWLPY